MKTIKICGSKIPKCKYAFMSKIKPVQNQYIFKVDPEGKGLIFDSLYRSAEYLDNLRYRISNWYIRKTNGWKKIEKDKNLEKLNKAFNTYREKKISGEFKSQNEEVKKEIKEENGLLEEEVEPSNKKEEISEKEKSIKTENQETKRYFFQRFLPRKHRIKIKFKKNFTFSEEDFINSKDPVKEKFRFMRNIRRAFHPTREIVYDKNEQIEVYDKTYKIVEIKNTFLAPFTREDINFFVIVYNFRDWVKKNARINTTHSQFYRGPLAIKLLNYLCIQNNFIHNCSFTKDNYDIFYQVMDYKKFRYNLENWTNFQVACMLHKPYFDLVFDEDLKYSQNKNLTNAVALACLTLISDDDPSKIVYDEREFFTHIANLPFLTKDLVQEVVGSLSDVVSNENLEDYRKMYKEILVNGKVKDYIKYIPKEKKIQITNTDKSREAFLQLIPSGLKKNFWILGSRRLFGKKYKNPLWNSLFMKDFLYILAKSPFYIKSILLNTLNVVNNSREINKFILKKLFLKKIIYIFAVFYGVLAILDSIREYIIEEDRIFEEINKSNLDWIEFNLINRELVEVNENQIHVKETKVQKEKEK